MRHPPIPTVTDREASEEPRDFCRKCLRTNGLLSVETGKIEHMFEKMKEPTFPQSAAPGGPESEVAGLDADATLSRLAEQRRVREQLEFAQLALAAHWADLHGHLDTASGSEGMVFPGSERLIGLGGDGTPGVAEFCPAELAAVLGM